MLVILTWIFLIIVKYNQYYTCTSPCILLAFRNSLAVACVNSVTSLLAGFAVFAVLGHIAQKQNQDIENVVTSGTVFNCHFN